MSEPTSPDCCACGCVNETRESRKSEWIYWTCGGWQHIDSGKFGVSGIENRGTHLALIRSLREELAEARDALFEAWPGAMDGQLFHKAITALMRFDNLNKKAETE